MYIVSKDIGNLTINGKIALDYRKDLDGDDFVRLGDFALYNFNDVLYILEKIVNDKLVYKNVLEMICAEDSFAPKKLKCLAKYGYDYTKITPGISLVINRLEENLYENCWRLGLRLSKWKRI